MRGHRLGVFDRSAIFEIGGNASGAEAVIADRRHDAGGGSAAADHRPGRLLVHRLTGQRIAVVAWAGAKQPALAVLGGPGLCGVGVIVDSVPNPTLSRVEELGPRVS